MAESIEDLGFLKYKIRHGLSSESLMALWASKSVEDEKRSPIRPVFVFMVREKGKGAGLTAVPLRPAYAPHVEGWNHRSLR